MSSTTIGDIITCRPCAFPTSREKEAVRVRTRNILMSFAFIMLTLFLILIVASRTSEAGGISLSAPAGSGGPDNALGDISIPGVVQTPVPTQHPEVEKPDVDVTSWEFILANSEHNIGNYAPAQTVSIEGTAQYFDSRAIDALLSFLQGARDAGFSPYIMTSYINYSSQEYIFNGRASQIAWGGTYTYEQAVEIARTVTFYPGTSDHQTGLAVDITDKWYSSLSSANVDEDLLEWLREHCAEYGFILRYPSLKESVTGWDEPWHFRYVGTTAAEYIMERGLCLEEFLELYE